jgi:hypothetical protein
MTAPGMAEPEPAADPAADPSDEATPVRSKAKVTKELNFLSEQLTDRCRFMAVAIIGACWVLVSSPSVYAPGILHLSILLAIFAVTADFLQYATQYRHFAERYRTMLEQNTDEIPLNPAAFLYRSRWHFFHLKVWLTAASAILFCVAAALELAHRHV